TSLSFTTSNWQTEQTVIVNAAADANAYSETVTLSHSADGGDYGSVTADLVVTATDDETASLVVSPEALTVAEAGSATYTVKLATEPTADVTVTMSGMGSGVSVVDTDRETEGEQARLNFSSSNWQTAQMVTVRATADANASSEAVTLSHSADGGDYGSVTADLVVTVTEEETASLVISPEAVTVAEAGSTTYTVKLATAPTEAVRVRVSGMGSGVSVDTDAGIRWEQTTLLFKPGNWNTAQTVMVSAAADANKSSETVTLSHAATGGEYGSVSKDLVVTVTDDDTPNLVFSVAALTVAEAGSDTYTVKLVKEPTTAV
ncbi:MAG: hypothetical protein TH68_05880, partial [Candidatus Synechococcus spongiarum 142]